MEDGYAVPESESHAVGFKFKREHSFGSFII